MATCADRYSFLFLSMIVTRILALPLIQGSNNGMKIVTVENMGNFGIRPDTDKYLRRFLICNLRPASAIKICYSSTLSCQNRCGTIVDKLPRKIRYSACSCDHACLIYKDCCWDFEKVCALEKLRYDQLKLDFRRLNLAKVECKRGVAFITIDVDEMENAGNDNGSYVSDDNSNNNDDDSFSKKHWTSRDFREPVVYINGLQFRNNSMFRFFSKGNTRNDSVIHWMKKIEPTELIPFKEIEELVHEGKASNMIRESLYDVPPSRIPIRMCATPSINVTCEYCPISPRKMELDPGNAGILCDVFVPITSEPQTQNTTTFTSTPSDGGVSVYYGTTQSIVEDSNQDVCDTEIDTVFSRRGFIAFSIAMSLRKSNEILVHHLNSVVDKHWVSLKNIELDSGGDRFRDKNKRYLIKICSPGYIFNGESCVAPRTLRVSVVGDVSSVVFVTEFTREMMKKMVEMSQLGDFHLQSEDFPDPSFKFMADVSEGRSVIIFDTEIGIMSYELSYDGARLPMTDKLIGIINQILQNDVTALASSKPSMAWKPGEENSLLINVCFQAPVTTLGIGGAYLLHDTESVSICDRLLWIEHRQPLGVRHFILNQSEGLLDVMEEELPLLWDPNDSSLHASQAKSNGHTRGLGLLSIIGVLLQHLFLSEGR